MAFSINILKRVLEEIKRIFLFQKERIWKKIKKTTKTYYAGSLIRPGKRYWYKVKARRINRKYSTSLYSPWITTMDYAWVP